MAGIASAAREAQQIAVVLASVRPVARDTNVYEFRRRDGVALPRYHPGSHITTYLPSGLAREYSLIPTPSGEGSYAIAVKCDPQSRGGSRYIHKALHVGDALHIGPPRNSFSLCDHAEQSIFIAGGIGITPFLSMIQRLGELQRRWTLHYACKSRAEMAFISDLERAAGARLHLDDESGGKFIDIAGVVAESPPDAHLYCCGPSPMMKAFEAATAAWPRTHIHLEYFAPRQESQALGGFTVELARSKRKIAVLPGQTILSAPLEAGVNVDYSCEMGLCGVCAQHVLSGLPEHHDSVLTPEEQNKAVMICCAGCKTDSLTLDL